MKKFKKYLKYFDRIVTPKITNEVQLGRIESLKENGFVILENFIKPGS